jgi:hypothetical protein
LIARENNSHRVPVGKILERSPSSRFTNLYVIVDSVGYFAKGIWEKHRLTMVLTGGIILRILSID